MAVSHLFRDMIFVKVGRLQINGLYTEIHIHVKICNLPFGDPKEIRNRHIHTGHSFLFVLRDPVSSNCSDPNCSGIDMYRCVFTAKARNK